jgi:hypothetical protein
MTTTMRSGWLDEPEHPEPVELGQAIAEWAAGQSHPGAPIADTYVSADQEAGQ